MSAIDARSAPPGEAHGVRATIFLQPIAAPSVLGDFAGASAFLLFGVWLAGGLGAPPAKAGVSIFPFILLFGGIGQLGAAMWSYKARDAVAASNHGAWGGFWMGYGFLWLLDAAKVITLPVFGHGFEALGQWFIYMAVITWTTAVAALSRGPDQFLTHATAAAAATVACAGLIAGSPDWQQAAGWIFVAAAALFIVQGARLMLHAMFGGGDPIEYAAGEPGVKVGQ